MGAPPHAGGRPPLMVSIQKAAPSIPVAAQGVIGQIFASGQTSLIQALLNAFAAFIPGINIPGLMNALQAAASPQTILNQIGWDKMLLPALEGEVQDAMLKLMGQGAAAEKAALFGTGKPGTGFSLKFDLLNPASVAWVKENGGKLIKLITDTQLDTIRGIIERAYLEGKDWKTAARQIKDSIGLLPHHEGAVHKLGAKLAKKGLGQAQIDKATQRYRERLLRARARTIARTETIRASTQGQQELWNQAIEQGFIDPTVAVKRWSTRDPCEICKPLHGQTAPVKGYFPGGYYLPPDPHPNCKCAVALLPKGDPKKGAIVAKPAPPKSIAEILAPFDEKKGPDGEPLLLADKMKAVGGQLGSNVGGTYEAPDGTRWYVKIMDEEHAANEVLAAQLYKAAGVRVPEIRHAQLKGKTAVASRILPVKHLTVEQMKALPGATEDFAVDAWLANYDVIGNGDAQALNLKALDGNPLRLDTGGALLFRAQGAAKPFGPTVPEFQTMRDKGKNPNAAAVFGPMSTKQLKSSINRVLAVPPEKVQELVKKYGPQGHPQLAQTLIARQADLAAKAKQLDQQIVAESVVAIPVKPPPPPTVVHVTPPPLSPPAKPHVPAPAPPPTPAPAPSGPPKLPPKGISNFTPGTQIPEGQTFPKDTWIKTYVKGHGPNDQFQVQYVLVPKGEPLPPKPPTTHSYVVPQQAQAKLKMWGSKSNLDPSYTPGKHITLAEHKAGLIPGMAEVPKPPPPPIPAVNISQVKPGAVLSTGATFTKDAWVVVPGHGPVLVPKGQVAPKGAWMPTVSQKALGEAAGKHGVKGYKEVMGAQAVAPEPATPLKPKYSQTDFYKGSAIPAGAVFEKDVFVFIAPPIQGQTGYYVKVPGGFPVPAGAKKPSAAQTKLGKIQAAQLTGAQQFPSSAKFGTYKDGKVTPPPDLPGAMPTSAPAAPAPPPIPAGPAQGTVDAPLKNAFQPPPGHQLVFKIKGHVTNKVYAYIPPGQAPPPGWKLSKYTSDPALASALAKLPALPGTPLGTVQSLAKVVKNHKGVHLVLEDGWVTMAGKPTWVVKGEKFGDPLTPITEQQALAAGAKLDQKAAKPPIKEAFKPGKIWIPGHGFVDNEKGLPKATAGDHYDPVDQKWVHVNAAGVITDLSHDLIGKPLPGAAPAAISTPSKGLAPFAPIPTTDATTAQVHMQTFDPANPHSHHDNSGLHTKLKGMTLPWSNSQREADAHQMIAAWRGSAQSSEARLFKEAVREAFNVPWKNITPPAGHLKGPGQMERYKAMAVELKKRAEAQMERIHGPDWRTKTIRLYRGLHAAGAVEPNVVEGWTTRLQTAQGFDGGHDGVILEDDVPLTEIFTWVSDKDWRAAGGTKFDGECEYLRLAPPTITWRRLR